MIFSGYFYWGKPLRAGGFLLDRLSGYIYKEKLIFARA